MKLLKTQLRLPQTKGLQKGSPAALLWGESKRLVDYFVTGMLSMCSTLPVTALS